MKDTNNHQTGKNPGKIPDILSSVRLSYNIGEEQLEESSGNTWNKIEQSTTPTRHNKSPAAYWKYISIAASIALLVVSSLFFQIIREQTQQTYEMQIANCSYGETKELKLPDGSLVWLNAGSRLVYPEKFSGKNREVFISGEAFFEVAKDKNKPFIVKSEEIAIKVFGTRFNVKSYPNEEKTEITLESGSIGFDWLDNHFKKIVTLSPNKRAEIFTETGKIIIEDVNSTFYTGWKEGKLRFRAQTFENIAVCLERAFNVKIYIQSERLKNEIYTGKFENGENVDQILNLIELNTKIKYTHKDGIYTIYEK